MGLFVKPEDMIISALSSRQPSLRLEHYVGPIEGAIKKALAKERRLIVFLDGYRMSGSKKSLVSLTADYEITFSYNSAAPESLDDVILDNHDFDPETLLTPGMPKPAVLVTADKDEVMQKLNDIHMYLCSRYEGMGGWNVKMCGMDKLSADLALWIGYIYFAPPGDLRMFRSKAVFQGRIIWRELLGNANVPPFVKAFLAYSYLMQECYYDEMAYAEQIQNPSEAPSDPVPHLSYGPLVEKRGVCSGVAWAYRELMDQAGVPCICVSGILTEKPQEPHMWNLVKLDGQYYHVDAACGLKSGGVTLAGLLKPDGEFAATHGWEQERFPKATGKRYGYDFIEDFLVEHGNDYLDAGASEKYMFPDRIIE